EAKTPQDLLFQVVFGSEAAKYHLKRLVFLESLWPSKPPHAGDRVICKRLAMKIVVIGGGSTYTPELIDGFIARAGVLGVKEIWLVDPNEERLKIVGAFAQR